MAELKPCPFCGSKSLGFYWEIDVCRIECKECGAKGPWEMERDFAEKIWNRRAEDGK